MFIGDAISREREQDGDIVLVFGKNWSAMHAHRPVKLRSPDDTNFPDFENSSSIIRRDG